MLRCLVLGLILGTFAIYIAPALSSKTLQCTLGVAFSTGTPCCMASFISHMIGKTSLMACESAMYSASVDAKAISVCILDDQYIGHPAYVITYPILDLAVFGSLDAVLLFHSEACAASTQHSIPS
jgi:hypothetical protein